MKKTTQSKTHSPLKLAKETVKTLTVKTGVCAGYNYPQWPIGNSQRCMTSA